MNLPDTTCPDSSRNPLNLSRRDALRLFGLTGVAALLPSTRLLAKDAAPAPSLQGDQPRHYRFKVGDFEALCLNDGGFAMPPADSPFGVNQPREKVAESLQAAFLPTDLVHMTFNVLLLRTPDGLVMIDAGTGNLFGPTAGHLPTALRAAGVDPKQIDVIIITHMHGDHFGGLLDASGQPVFPNAELFIHRKEHAFWAGGESDRLGDSAKGARRYLDAFKDKWQFVEGGDKPAPGIEIIDAFGHTPGHINLAITSGNEQLLHFVDIAHHSAISFAHPEWVIAWDVLPELGIESRTKVMDRASADKARVFGAHMPFPSLGHVRRAGKAFEYVIEPWVVV